MRVPARKKEKKMDKQIHDEESEDLMEEASVEQENDSYRKLQF